MEATFPQITTPFSRIPIEVLSLIAQVARFELSHKFLGRNAVFFFKDMTHALEIRVLRLRQLGLTVQRISQNITSLFLINPTWKFSFDCYLDHIFLLRPAVFDVRDNRLFVVRHAMKWSAVVNREDATPPSLRGLLQTKLVHFRHEGLIIHRRAHVGDVILARGKIDSSRR